MSHSKSIFGAGLFCIDIIQTKVMDQKTCYIQNGGSCSNVLEILAKQGWRSSAMVPAFDDELSVYYLNRLKDNIPTLIQYGNSIRIPRTRTSFNKSGSPRYSTTCPVCQRPLFKIALPSEADTKLVVQQHKFNGYFYHDRISPGVKQLIHAAVLNGATIVYEPNSARNKKGFLDHSRECDIVKFSAKKIPDSLSECLRVEAGRSRVKLLIKTSGHEGLDYSFRLDESTLSPWVHVPNYVDRVVADSSGAGDWVTAGILFSAEENNIDFLSLSANELALVFEQAGVFARLCCAGIGAQGSLYGPDEMASLVLNGKTYSSPYGSDFLQRIEDGEFCTESISTNVH